MSDITPPNPAGKAADRTRAHRIRAKVKRNEAVEPVEAAWLADYEKAQSMGASASRRVSYTEEEHAAVGTGSAAEVAAAAALAREEGRRIDYLAKVGIDALVGACNMYKDMCQQLLQRTQQIEDVHMTMLGSVREHYIARTQAEADAMRTQAQADLAAEQQPGMEQMALAMLLQRMGVPQIPGQTPTPTAGHRKPAGSKRAK